MKQLPLCVGIICVTAIIITVIVCKVSLETIFDYWIDDYCFRSCQLN